MANSIKDTDKGYAQLLKRLASLKAVPTVKVGVMGSKAEAPRDGGVTTGDIATFHEFGTTNSPERSWCRATVDDALPEIQDLQRKLTKHVIGGRIEERKALELIGMTVQTKMIERIRAIIPPPNAKSTVDAKGSSTPLIDSGQFVQAITYAVEDKK